MPDVQGALAWGIFRKEGAGEPLEGGQGRGSGRFSVPDTHEQVSETKSSPVRQTVPPRPDTDQAGFVGFNG